MGVWAWRYVVGVGWFVVSRQQAQMREAPAARNLSVTGQIHSPHIRMAVWEGHAVRIQVPCIILPGSSNTLQRDEIEKLVETRIL